MQQATAIRLIEGALDNIEAKGTDTDGGVTYTDVSWYTDPGRLAQEREHVFGRTPVVVGFSSRVARPGDFFTHDESGVGILVVRGRDGELRAFVNACRHRGTRLVGDACGAGKKSFVCPYHAWTYDTAGALRGVPHDEVFPGLEMRGLGLHPLPVGERAGLIYVVPRGRGELDLDGFLGDTMAELSTFGFDDHVVFAESRREHRLNWKLLMDSSLETYHFRTVHAKTIYAMFFDNTGVFEWQEPHARMILPKRTMRDLRGQDPQAWNIRDHSNILYAIFPNTLVLVQPDHAMVTSIFPAGVDRSVLVSGMLVPEAPVSDAAKAHWLKNEQIFWDAIEEDLEMGELMQQTLSWGANHRLTFGSHEHLITKFHDVVNRRLTDPDG